MDGIRLQRMEFFFGPQIMCQDVSITFVTQFYGENWADKKLHIYHSSGKKWVVMLKRVKCMPVLTDGWQTVVSELNLQKNCLLTFLPLNHFGLHLSSYVNGVCGQSYFTINHHLRLGFTIIEDSFVQECFEDNVVAGSYEINYKGSSWTVSTNEVEIRLSKKVESDDDDVFQISKADYFKTLLKDIEEDDNIYIPDESPSGTVPSRTPKKVHVKETLKKGDASHFKTMQDVKGKGKAKLFADRSDTVENLNKECKRRKRSTKSDSIPYRPSAETVKY
ncbi:putative DNA-binding pseudobarrel domain superfamily [Helianthus annuus]|uniref:uncharacterized protein LOC110897941 isoform X2 n=1 Tax=Helianthus annuus TaxID=4232 RepID=UPI000B908F48|nr:uncharacterized protein LOC110897941 isoform X2 [Helianthus annuus]KAJ0476209.1 putative DNA-binding pseudobarrel domain superfamily [Helianthus annuus]KAJ0497016.1 putative DNA-binding pseudobarrel domain superfamily [Helianthus annuus]KAJ0663047.1 putative DNA-binding pseudobarrel domain superfamily [Helianthus annuus]